MRKADGALIGKTISTGTRLSDANHTLPKRFESKCGEPDENGCIHWLGTKSAGYGLIRINGDPKTPMAKAHRIAWILKHGDIPAEVLVCHTCDNRYCVNVNHLFLGTYEENTQDMKAKGRHFWKEKLPWQKLASVDGERIHDLRRAGHTQQEIAGWLDVSRPLISMILSGKIQHSRT